MDGHIPLSALLSRALVAFTIEFDNEFERRLPHRTTNFGGPRGGLWAVSLMMWSNFMRVVDDDGLPVGELTRRALTSQPRQAFARAYEQRSKVSLSHTANVVRLLDRRGARVSELPELAGVATEALRTAVGILEKRGIVELVPDPGAARGKLARLTDSGARVKAAYGPRTTAIEERWRERFGAEEIDDVRASLERVVVGRGGGDRSPLFAGLVPPPGSWRSKVRQFDVLPDFPMPRQGGHPDGW